MKIALFEPEVWDGRERLGLGLLDGVGRVVVLRVGVNAEGGGRALGRVYVMVRIGVSP